ncbi:hypothetical protein [Pseudoflavonifractor phocaeensis]|uniref:hypothetical protein n=1 Tax=Pseudoflavonifractor phocaeensis TaxID=1870988 RepID=UPI00210880E7|nr:hypothetical protein [Pseudoflavonifractor phocaeensis]MCQ4862677.1 hypothetical protein [Pseudoflavonifractor phocaeensis]
MEELVPILAQPCVPDKDERVLHLEETADDAGRRQEGEVLDDELGSGDLFRFLQQLTGRKSQPPGLHVVVAGIQARFE